MSVLNRIAAAQGRRDEAPNQEQARELAEQEDRASIRELAANLHHADQNVRTDCLKTLYAVGYLKPELIADYAGEFVRLLHDCAAAGRRAVPATPTHPGRAGRRLGDHSG